MKVNFTKLLNYTAIACLLLACCSFQTLSSELKTKKDSKGREKKPDGFLHKGLKLLTSALVEDRPKLGCQMEFLLQSTLQDILPSAVQGDKPRLEYAYYCGDKITIQPNTSIPNNTNNNNTQNNGTNGSNGNGTKPPITPGKTAYFNHVRLGLISTITLIVTFY
eukprot:403332931